jgi:cyclase
MSIHHGKCALLLTLAVLLTWPAVLPSQDFSRVQIKTMKMGNGVYMLTGAGGNIGVSAGADGILLIDSQFAQLHDKIKAALAAIAPGQARFLCNTNWHYDHVSGNEPFAKDGAVIIAHEKSRERMTREQSHDDFKIKIPAYPAAALPLLTFADALVMHVNGDDVRIQHIPGAHSDADLFFHFRKANVIHAGDLLFSGIYPYIDVAHGGSIDGMIAAVDRLLQLGDADTRWIPGHGPAMKTEDVAAYRDMLLLVRKRVAALIQEGKSLDEIISAKPASGIAGRWQGNDSPDLFVRLIYDCLAKK